MLNSLVKNLLGLNTFFCFKHSKAPLQLDGAEVAPSGDIVNQTAQTEESRLLQRKNKT
jgi:hypothetical protein